VDPSSQGGGFGGWLQDIAGSALKGAADYFAERERYKTARLNAEQEMLRATVAGDRFERSETRQLAARSDSIKYLALAAVGLGAVIFLVKAAK
jgi:hypothetical protein